MASAVIWLLISLISFTTCQRMQYSNSTVCRGGNFRSMTELDALRGCITVLGNVQVFIESAIEPHFVPLDVREITEYLVLYRVIGLESVGQLFPNLVRIRGLRLLNNFALIVFENDHLREIGLYSLLKIDRGGVIMWLLPQACFIDTIDWNILVPNARRVIDFSHNGVQCNFPCTCTANASTNHCWNNLKCQLYLEGLDAHKCDEQCLGCINSNKPLKCSVCRYYTHNGQCLPKCPANTILVPDNFYCITEDECASLDRIVFNNTCVADCPIGYERKKYKGKFKCKICVDCKKICKSLIIKSMSSIEAADKCVYIDGYLYINLKSVPEGNTALGKYLSQIKEVSDYVYIEGSDIIRSLDFLKSLRRIRGRKLRENKYSLDIKNNINLDRLFVANVTKHLQIDRGILRFEMNPKLCMNKIERDRKLFPNKTLVIQVHEGTNGYSGDCEEVRFKVDLEHNSETSMKVKFSPVNFKAFYTIVYVRLPLGIQMSVLPESCSVFEWQSIDVPIIYEQNFGVVNLTSLRLASIYVFCIEVHNPDKKRLARSDLYNFTTPIGVPEPPFILELVASSSDSVVLHWLDHQDYASSITYYELDVSLIDVQSRGLPAIDYCNYKEDPFIYENDYYRHAFVRRAPPEYGKGCESMCGVQSTVPPGVMAEDHFDVCDNNIIKHCDNIESIISKNETFGKFVRTLALNISRSTNNEFHVEGLAPFSDYKFRLRACVNKICSRSAHGIVRTLHLENADIPAVEYAYADQYGSVHVKWKHPEASNGPILTYIVEVMPKMNLYNFLPQSWCLLSNETEIVAKSVVSSNYLVRVCAQTIFSSKSCNDEWIAVMAFYNTNEIWFAICVPCGFLLYITCVLFGWYYNKRNNRNDDYDQPLIEIESLSRIESDPPCEIIDSTEV